MGWTAYIIPVIFLTVLLVSFFKKKTGYNIFIDGSKSAISLMAQVFPFLLTVLVAVELFRASGVSAAVANFLSPALNLVGIPAELTELMLVRPLSGAGALAILDNIFTRYGADTYIGLCASIIYGSSETVFYVSSVYFSQTKIKNLRYAIPVSLAATFLGCVLGCLLMRFFL
ncbi:MAG: spore maturation protein [Clostridiales bacterium]|jgi:spore maturation protein B|nr:spore maturation protein [Clostridiales bacterium]